MSSLTNWVEIGKPLWNKFTFIKDCFCIYLALSNVNEVSIEMLLASKVVFMGFSKLSNTADIENDKFKVKWIIRNSFFY